MTVELGGISLQRIHRMATLEKADLVEHRIPGMVGSVVQDLGRSAVRLSISGILYGAETASRDLEALRQLHQARQPVDFIAEIVGSAYFSQVVIEQFEVAQQAQEPNQFSYQLVIAESADPGKKPGAKATVSPQTAAKAKATELKKMAALPDALEMGAMPEITNPFEPLGGAIAPVQAATKGFDQAASGLKQIFGLP